ncbi:class I SAM-dependent methyltransferase [Rhodocytophaga rosea]|uniref:Class I SAM-dependent methyltransferase n=1 Tax=Rhodocytophaga rosea TaxID=2704465 RepID=A0A6C0GDE3_9BACT|nr:class I SAM-dependent methyltransferase [Rhodocytophaga rosea]QHT65782.1 class I SAM-dependent methyltransferase [Rhodocytophaga rosea]
MTSTTQPFVNSLICPVCKGKIEYTDDMISCLSCHSQFPQPKKEYINLLPHEAINKKEGNWQERQQEMELWYKDLLTDINSAVSLFKHDYAPFSDYFAKLSGNILDLGGGVGVVRHYLPENCNYIVVDPSTDWLSSDWNLLSKSYPCLAEKPNFIMGVGEFLMFNDNSFDSVLAFWSINHVNDPLKVFKEVQRVLKPGGKFLVVFEDMEPWWSDFLSSSMRRQFEQERLKEMIDQKIKSSLLGNKWPVQADHIFITDKDIKEWINNRFEKINRQWIGTYLTYEFKKN